MIQCIKPIMVTIVAILFLQPGRPKDDLLVNLYLNMVSLKQEGINVKLI